jgi:hypothetical protein
MRADSGAGARVGVGFGLGVGLGVGTVEMGEPTMELQGHAGVNLSACALAWKL